MSQQGHTPPWLYNSERRQWYRYDARADEIEFENRRRIPRPPTVSKASLLSATLTNPASSYNQPQTALPNAEHRANQPHRFTPGPLGSQPGQRVQQPQQPHPSLAYASNQATGNTVKALSGLTLRDQPSQHATPVAPAPSRSDHPVKTAREGGFISAVDEVNKVRTKFQTSPPELITDPRLAQAGIYAQSLLLETPGEAEVLFDTYRRRETPRKFFVFGRVFFVLWAEPQSDASALGTGLEPSSSLNKYGQPVYSKARRFVVIREGNSYCSCLPITTYGGQGVAKPGVKKSEHSIIHTDKTAPAARSSELAGRGENGMQPSAIRVSADDPSDKLNNMSRLDYGKVHTIHHNLKVRNFGKVNPQSTDALRRQFGNVWNNQSAPIGESSSAGGTSAPTAPAPQRQPAAVRPRHDSGMGHASPEQQARSGAASRKTNEGRRVTSDERSGSSSDGQGPEETVASSQEQQLQSSAREAVQRMVARGFTHEQAYAALRRESQRLRGSTQKAAARRDDDDSSVAESGSDSEDVDDDNDDDDRTHNSNRSRGNRSLGQPRARRESSSHTGAIGLNVQAQGQRREPSQLRGISRAMQTTDSSSRKQGHPQPRVQPQPQQQQQPRPQPQASGSNTQPTAAERAQRAEQAIRNLEAQGYSRSQATDIIRKHVGGGGRG